MKTKSILLVGWTVTLIALILSWAVPRQPQIVDHYIYQTETIEMPIETLRVQVKYVPIYGNQTDLRQFESKAELQGYVQWYRTEKMVQYDPNRCVDYATDFMRQALAEGFLVSTEVIYQEYESKLFTPTFHMINTAVVGENVWAIDISTGEIKLFGTKGG